MIIQKPIDKAFLEAFGLVVDDGSRKFDTREEAEDYLDENDDPRNWELNFVTMKYEIPSWDEYYGRG